LAPRSEQPPIRPTTNRTPVSDKTCREVRMSGVIKMLADLNLHSISAPHRE
jgi:hypothetical protein